MARRFSGGSQTWDAPAYLVKGSNITSDRDTGIGSLSEADGKRAMVEGVRPCGVPLAPQMPFVFYNILTPRDVHPALAYIPSLPAARHTGPPPRFKAATE